MTAGVDRAIVPPSQDVVVPVTEGVAGLAFTVTVAEPAAEVQPFTVTVTEYVPLIAVVALPIEMFCVEAVNELGPVQE